MNSRDLLPCSTIFLCFTVIHAQLENVPLLSARAKRGLPSRERVKKLQLQSMLNSLAKRDDELEHFLNIKRTDTVKREADGSPIENKHLTQLFGEHIPWDIVRRQVPFDALIKRNKNDKDSIKVLKDTFFDQKSSSPCRHKRSTLQEESAVNKRNLNTPAGDGIVPAYNIYDELCEDSQPVEVVKIDKLVVQDGVIRDQNIIEKAMLE